MQIHHASALRKAAVVLTLLAAFLLVSLVANTATAFADDPSHDSSLQSHHTTHLHASSVGAVIGSLDTDDLNGFHAVNLHRHDRDKDLHDRDLDKDTHDDLNVAPHHNSHDTHKH